MKFRWITALLLVLLVLAGCLQVRDSWLPDPGEADPDPAPGGDGTIPVRLKLAAGTGGLVLDSDGASAISQVEVSYRSLPIAEVAAGTAGSVTLQPGAQASIELPEGDYRFSSIALAEGFDLPLALGSMDVEIDDDPPVIELRLEPVLGAVTLLPAVPTDTVQPGAPVGLKLQLWSAAGEFQVPTARVQVDYSSNSAEPLVLADDQLTAMATAPAEGVLRIGATVTGLVLVAGEPDPTGVLEAADLELTVQTPVQAARDWQPPVLVFDALDRAAGMIGGSASDDTGLASLRIYRGSELLGSSTAADAAPASVDFSATDSERWSMAWTPDSGGSQVLRAVATDLSGNSTTVFQALDALPPEDPEDLSSYSTVEGETSGEPEGFDGNAGFCPANEFSTPGQGLQAVGAGLQAVGAIGGLLLAPEAAFLPGSASVARVASELDFVTLPAQHADVTMIVVDDFGADVHTLPEAIRNADVTAEGLAQLAADGLITHGALVLHHTIRLFESHGYLELDRFQEANHGIPTVVLARPDAPDGGLFVLRLVNTHERDTSEMAAALRQVYGAQPVGSQASRRFVVNMSFVMLPCAVTSDLAASGINNLQDYLQALAVINHVEVADLTELVMKQPLGDDLLEYLRCPFHTAGDCSATGTYADSIVHVASAGNFGSDFPLLPAAAPTVIAVSSQDAASGGFAGLSGFSNPGSVMAPGANFELASHAGMTVGYAGTSFAAPVVSVLSALDLARAQPECSAAPALAAGMQVPVLADIWLQGANHTNVPLSSELAGGTGPVTVADLCGSPLQVN